MNKILLSLFFVLFAFSSVSSAATVTIDEANLLHTLDANKAVGSGFTDEHDLILNNLNPANTGFKVVFNLTDNESGSIAGLKGELWNGAGTIKIYDILANVGSNPIPPLFLATGNYILKVIADSVASGVFANAEGQQYSLDINAAAVPVPAAIWLFGSALMGLVGFSRRKTN
ncbi:hypothetical protein [Methylobacter sp.]|uniref:hypothetical protein n=1 Tax=Methylobacter sp. TaxID=2051955 RepID=UPI003DA66069